MCARSWIQSFSVDWAAFAAPLFVRGPNRETADG